MSEPGSSRRRLAAVLFADIVGFSTLASSDEDGALAVAAIFRAVFEEQTSEAGGRVVKFLGDGGMGSFESAEAAGRAARNLALEFRRAAAASGSPAALRIGIHVGDVVEGADGDVHGDGVNTAARLQAAAEADSILVSEAVWRQLRQRRGFVFRFVGEQELKGMAAPERTYALLFEGEDAGGGPAAASGSTRVPRAAAGRARWAGSRASGPLGLVGVVALSTVVAWAYLGVTSRRLDVGGPGPVMRVAITLPEGQLLGIARPRAHPLGISQDGSLLVYSGWTDGATRLFLRSIGAFEARPLPGTEEAEQPFFSPDGQWVGFFADGRLQKVAVAGGAPIAVAQVAEPPFGAAWGSDDTMLFATLGGGLFRVPASGGEPARLLAADSAGLESPRWPGFLPDPRYALITTDAGVHALTLETGELSHLVAGSQGRHLPTGHLAFLEEDELLRVVPFDLERREVVGPVTPVADNVFRGPGGGAAMFAVSQTGTLVYVTGGYERSLALVDRNGRETPLDLEPRGYRFPEVSPDGRFVAVTVDPRPSDVWVIDLERGSATRLTTEGHNLGGKWSPDGRRLAFAHDDDQYVVDWPDMGEPRRVSARPLPQYGPSWTRDGRILAAETTPSTGLDIVVLNLADGSSEEFLATAADESQPKVSPDSRWVAYRSDVSGTNEIYVVPYERPSAPRLVSVGGGSDPAWSKDGSELFYRRGSAIMAVQVTAATDFVAGPPQELFSGPYDFTQGGNWGPTPDGRFVMVRGDPATTRQFRVVLNWFQELRREPGDP